MTEFESDPETAGSMVEVLREILEDEEMTYDELDEEIHRRKQAAIRHLVFNGEWKRDTCIEETIKRTVTVVPRE